MPEVAAFLSPSAWSDTARWVEANLGLHFTPQQLPDLQRGLEGAAKRLGLPGAAACAQQALAQGFAADDLQVLAESLTIGETYFFRDPAVFDQLAEQVLKPLAARRRQGTRHLRLWSAGCATGEEPYSLAMLVASVLPDWREWNITILATDINRTALQKAKAGAYGRWSVRGGMSPHARPFLHRGADGRYHVDAELRRLVRFAPLNLAVDDYPSPAALTSAMDLVLCRNVLIYFEPQRAQAVLERLGRALADDGWLVTGAVELPRLRVPGLVVANSGGLAALRPGAAVPNAATASRAAAAAAPSPRAASAPAAAHRPPSSAVQPAGASGLPSAALDANALAEDARGSANAGQLEQAERLCREAIAQDKLNAEWTYLLASILMERGDLEAAATALQRTLYLEPEHLLARFALGSLALRQGQSDTGRRHFSRALARLTACAADDVVQGGGGLTARELESIIRRTEAGIR
jgi:chemotaxis protein methyltransferase CheR